MLRYLTFLTLVAFCSAETLEITQKKSGKTLSVEIISSTYDEVTFSLNDKEYTVPLDSLTEKSQEEINALNFGKDDEKDTEPKENNVEDGFFEDKKDAPVKEASGETAETFAAVNEAIGHELFGSAETLWEEKAEDIADRLGWKKESKKENNSSYRLYTKLNYTFLGAHPYCVTLYGGASDTPERFSLVFANKGDYGSSVGMGEDHFKTIYDVEQAPEDLDDAIELDQGVIAETLTSVLGEPEQQYYGEKEDMRRVQRWDTGDHSFLLSARDGEYVHLLIVRTSDADAKGKVQFVKDSDLKKVQLTNVRQEENGDVWIDNIPMVNQGPKGYCAPATFERAMRYMQVPADMYLLATAATGPKGTNTTKLADDCKRIVRSKARRIKELSLEDDFKIKNLKKSIDKGVPVLWQMCSLPSYNKIANERTKERSETEDLAAWATEIQEEADKVAETLTTKDNFHICMVIGYNEATNEVAVSDSWGPAYELRWVHVDICQAVTSRGGFVIDF